MLSIVNDAAARLSLVQTPVVTTSQDRQITQLWYLLNEVGHAMAEHYPWQALVNEWLFSTVNSPTQTSALPVDFDRFINNTTFNRSTRRGVLGPITARRWQAIQAQPVYSLIYLSFRIRTGDYIMTPTPPAGETIALEYVSTNWVIGDPSQPDPGPKPKFDQDTDTTLLDEEVLTLGLVWRFLRAKGLDYAEEMKSYERALEIKCAQDGGATEITTTPRPIDPSRINLPDGSFGVP